MHNTACHHDISFLHCFNCLHTISATVFPVSMSTGPRPCDYTHGVFKRESCDTHTRSKPKGQFMELTIHSLYVRGNWPVNVFVCACTSENYLSQYAMATQYRCDVREHACVVIVFVVFVDRCAMRSLLCSKLAAHIYSARGYFFLHKIMQLWTRWNRLHINFAGFFLLLNFGERISYFWSESKGKFRCLLWLIKAWARTFLILNPACLWRSQTNFRFLDRTVLRRRRSLTSRGVQYSAFALGTVHCIAVWLWYEIVCVFKSKLLHLILVFRTLTINCFTVMCLLLSGNIYKCGPIQELGGSRIHVRQRW